MKIVELAGPNGVGKSFFSNLIVKNKSFILQKELPFWTKYPKAFKFANRIKLVKAINPFLLKITRLLYIKEVYHLRSLLQISSTNLLIHHYVSALNDENARTDEGLLVKRLRYFLDSLDLYYLARKANEFDELETVIFDEGLSQRALSLALHEVKKSTILDYIRLVPKPDYLICFSASSKTIMDRRRHRGSAVGNEQEIQYQKNILKELALIYQEYGVKVIWINGEDSSELNLKKVIEWIEN
jgi:hypothetical protein